MCIRDSVETVRRAVFDHLDAEDIPAIRRFFDSVLALDEAVVDPKLAVAE